MSKTLLRIQAEYLREHFNELAAARDRADAVDTSDVGLERGLDLQLLAATGADSLDELIEGVRVIRRLKRSMLIQIGNLLYYANRWGVLICLVPSPCQIGSFTAAWGPMLSSSFEERLLKLLGVTRTYHGTRDCLHDYSACSPTTSRVG